jgi:hypothetical protein
MFTLLRLDLDCLYALAQNADPLKKGFEDPPNSRHAKKQSRPPKIAYMLVS